MPKKTFPMAIKHVFNMLRGIFLAKFFAQCTLEGRNLEQFEKKSETIWKLKSVQKRY